MSCFLCWNTINILVHPGNADGDQNKYKDLEKRAYENESDLAYHIFALLSLLSASISNT